MKKIIAFAFAGVVALGIASTAEARDGCGYGRHRAPNGLCYDNGMGPGVVVAAPGVAVGVGVPGIGVYVGGRGWWDGHRYWGNRYRWHGGWRYR